MSTEVKEQMKRAIAEFMGEKILTADNGDPVIKKNGKIHYFPRWAKYHEDWNQLRKVIDKIFTYAIAYPEQVKKVIDLKIVVNIDAAHKAVYDFIQWYNSAINTSK